MRGSFRLAGAMCVAGLVAAVSAGSAFGALPRSYAVQRVDDPTPSVGANFGLSMANAHDVNGDGQDDLIVGTDKHGRGVGQVLVVSGGTGAVIRELKLPDADPGGPGERAAGFGAAVRNIKDLGSCSGAAFSVTPDGICDPSPTGPGGAIGPPDGVDDLLASASGVDVDANGDDLGVVYVFDGATGAMLKRLRMPPADRAQQAGFDVDPRYGRSLLSPAGLWPCEGNAGLGSCPPTSGTGSVPGEVRTGDLNGGGRADIVAAATDYTESGTTANPESECFVTSQPECGEAGRVYVFYGEEVAGSDPSSAEESPNMTIKNPSAQTDIPNAPGGTEAEELGSLLIPVGDLGKCNADPGPGRTCAGASSTTSRDGRPDFVATSPSTNLFGMFDVGVAYLVDGDDGSILSGYEHPEPQPGSAMGLTQNGMVQPAFGNLGQGTEPDVYVPVLNLNTGHLASGRGYLFNGNFKSRFRFRNFAQVNDPTPANSGQFGASTAGIGEVAGDTVTKELLVGATGPHAPGTNLAVINDVHIFTTTDERPVQTILAPDKQPGAGFGTGVAPLGDLNEDGFLDFAVSAGLYDLTSRPGSACAATCADAGRLYIFRSDNSPAPSPPGGTGSGATPTASALAGRDVELVANRNRLRRRGLLKLIGVIEAFANDAGCEPGQQVLMQRRRLGSLRYRTFKRVRSNASGVFRARTRPRRSYVYRARVNRTSQCLGAVSNRERVTVRRRARG